MRKPPSSSGPRRRASRPRPRPARWPTCSRPSAGARAATTIPALAPWIAAALAPGVPLYVVGGVRLDDPDVHAVDSLEPEAPFDFLAVGGEVDPVGLLLPGGLALLVGRAPVPPGLIAVEVGEGTALAVRSL